jgi:hypothetical protein
MSSSIRPRGSARENISAQRRRNVLSGVSSPGWNFEKAKDPKKKEESTGIAPK